MLTRRYPKGPPLIDPADQQLIDHARALLRPRLLERAREQDLLAPVYAAPHLDGPRLIYADWLLERGDVYGELIQLQILAERGPLKKAAKARLAELSLDGSKRRSYWRRVDFDSTGRGRRRRVRRARCSLSASMSTTRRS